MKERFLIPGRADSGKTYLVLQKFLRFADRHKEDNVIFILPTHSQVEHIRNHILRVSGIKGYFDTNLVTFHGLAEKILENSCLKNPISECEKDIVISNIFKTINTKYFSGVLDFPGFKKTFLNFAREIKENSLSPLSLKSLLEEVLSSKKVSIFKLKYNELVTFYDCYQQTLKEKGLMDREDFLEQALDCLSRDNRFFLKPNYY